MTRLRFVKFAKHGFRNTALMKGSKIDEGFETTHELGAPSIAKRWVGCPSQARMGYSAIFRAGTI